MTQPKRSMKMIDFKDPRTVGGILLPLPIGPYIKVPQGRESDYPIGEPWTAALARAESLGDMVSEFCPTWGSVLFGSVNGLVTTVGYYADTSD